MIVLRTPEGLDRTEDRGRAEDRRLLARAPGSVHHGEAEASARCWKNGCRATSRTSCLRKEGKLRDDIAALAPKGTRRMSANPHANGGLLKKPLKLPDFRDYAVDGQSPDGWTSKPRAVWARSCAT